MANVYCEYCGSKSATVASLVAGQCPRHPNGINQGHHKLYEGSEKPEYTCKYCGTTKKRIYDLTGSQCPKHPKGMNRGMHEPAR